MNNKTLYRLKCGVEGDVRHPKENYLDYMEVTTVVSESVHSFQRIVPLKKVWEIQIRSSSSKISKLL